MSYEKIELKKGVMLHLLDTDNFKTNLMAIFLTTPITRKNVTFNSVLSSVLRRGTKKINTQEELSKKMEELYGAEYNCGINKMGYNHVLKFYMETINDVFLPTERENMQEIGFDILSDLAFNPFIVDGKFNDEYVEQEKKNIRQIIESKKDNKANYSAFRCMEEMYKNDPEGLYRFGYIEDLDKINSKNLYEYYVDLIKECKIDIFVSGNLKNSNLVEIIKNNKNIENLNLRDAKYIINKPKMILEQSKEKYVEESQDVTQGKLAIGYDIIKNAEELDEEDLKYIGIVYSAILGGSANSKLFQNVREKASLAYSVNSSYIYNYGNLFIYAGINIENYDKAVKIIKQQINDMKNGDFTEEEIDNTKKILISNIKSIEDEQDTQIIYYFGQEIEFYKNDLEKYIEKVNNVSKAQIINFAKKLKINMIYFLKN